MALLDKESVTLMHALCVAAAALAEPKAPLGEAEILPGAAVPVACANVVLPAGVSEAKEEAVAEEEALPASAAAAPPPMVALLQGEGLLERQGCALKLELVHADALTLAHSLLLRVTEAEARAVPLGNGVALAEPVYTPAVTVELKLEEGATGVALALPTVPCALPVLLPVGSLPVAVALAEALGAPETEGGFEMLELLKGLRVSVAQGVAELLVLPLPLRLPGPPLALKVPLHVPEALGEVQGVAVPLPAPFAAPAPLAVPRALALPHCVAWAEAEMLALLEGHELTLSALGLPLTEVLREPVPVAPRTEKEGLPLLLPTPHHTPLALALRAAVGLADAQALAGAVEQAVPVPVPKILSEALEQAVALLQALLLPVPAAEALPLAGEAVALPQAVELMLPHAVGAMVRDGWAPLGLALMLAHGDGLRGALPLAVALLHWLLLAVEHMEALEVGGKAVALEAGLLLGAREAVAVPLAQALALALTLVLALLEARAVTVGAAREGLPVGVSVVLGQPLDEALRLALLGVALLRVLSLAPALPLPVLLALTELQVVPEAVMHALALPVSVAECVALLQGECVEGAEGAVVRLTLLQALEEGVGHVLEEALRVVCAMLLRLPLPLTEGEAVAVLFSESVALVVEQGEDVLLPRLPVGLVEAHALLLTLEVGEREGVFVLLEVRLALGLLLAQALTLLLLLEQVVALGEGLVLRVARALTLARGLLLLMLL